MTNEEAYKKLHAKHRVIADNLLNMCPWFTDAVSLAEKVIIRTDSPEVRDLVVMAAKHLIDLEVERRRY